MIRPSSGPLEAPRPHHPCEEDASRASCPQMLSPDGCCQFPSPNPSWPSPQGLAHTKGRGGKAALADRASCLSISFLCCWCWADVLLSTDIAPAHSFPVTFLVAWFYLVQGISKFTHDPFTGKSSRVHVSNAGSESLGMRPQNLFFFSRYLWWFSCTLKFESHWSLATSPRYFYFILFGPQENGIELTIHQFMYYSHYPSTLFPEM